GLETYYNVTNVTQRPTSLNRPWSDVNAAACNYSNDDFVVNDNIFPMTPDGHVDFATQNYQAQYNRNNTITEQDSIQNPPQSIMDTSSSLPNGSPNMSFNPPQTPINDSEIFKFAIPGFQIIVIPTSAPFAYSNNFDMQYQFQRDDAFSSYNSPQLHQDISSVHETPGGSSIDIYNNRSQPYHHQQTL